MPELPLTRWDWLLVSIIIATLASMLHWSVRRQANARQGSWHTFRTVIENPWVMHSARLLYGIGLPATLLFWQHTLTARGLGLRPLFSLMTTTSPASVTSQWAEWIRHLGWAALIAGVAGVVIALGDRASRPLQHNTISKRRDLLIALREAAYHQVHWAFYREPFLVAFRFAVGAWLGTLPVLLETLINPMFWDDLLSQDSARQRHLLIRAGLFVVGTQIFVTTENLWMGVAVDALLGWIFLPTEGVTE